MNTRTILAAALFAASVPFAAHAAPEQGFYLGGQVGNASIDEDFLDDDDTSFGVYGGYKFNRYFAVEGAYTNFGSLDGRITNGTDTVFFGTDPQSFALKAVGILPIGEQFSLYGNVGFHSWDLDQGSGDNIGDVIGDDSATDPTYGIGGQFDFANNWAIRAQLQRYEFDNADLDEVSLGVQYTF